MERWRVTKSTDPLSVSGSSRTVSSANLLLYWRPREVTLPHVNMWWHRSSDSRLFPKCSLRNVSQSMYRRAKISRKPKLFHIAAAHCRTLDSACFSQSPVTVASNRAVGEIVHSSIFMCSPNFFWGTVSKFIGKNIYSFQTTSIWYVDNVFKTVGQRTHAVKDISVTFDFDVEHWNRRI